MLLSDVLILYNLNGKESIRFKNISEQLVDSQLLFLRIGNDVIWLWRFSETFLLILVSGLPV